MHRELLLSSWQPGKEFILYQSFLVKKGKKWTRMAGSFLIAISLFFFISLFNPLTLEENYLNSPNLDDFTLIIPKINLIAPVLANINPVNQEEYDQVLKKGLAHAKGTSLPGEKGTVFVFGHSTGFFWETNPYSTIFYPLKNLNKNDEISIIFAGKHFDYQVMEKKVVGADEVSLLTSNEAKLVLETCWPPGTNWKRLVVIAKPDLAHNLTK